jgi:hypothetical protein
MLKNDQEKHVSKQIIECDASLRGGDFEITHMQPLGKQINGGESAMG